MPTLVDPKFATGICRPAENLMQCSHGLSGTYSTFYLLLRQLMAGSMVAEEELPQVNGTREEQLWRNGVLYDEIVCGEGMEISDGLQGYGWSHGVSHFSHTFPFGAAVLEQAQGSAICGSTIILYFCLSELSSVKSTILGGYL